MCVVAVVAAVLVWQWRAHRGPTMVAALALGAAVAAGAAAGVGAVLVHWRYGAIDVDAAPISPEHRVHYVIEAPPVFFGHSPLQAAVTILFPGGDRGPGLRAHRSGDRTRRPGWPGRRSSILAGAPAAVRHSGERSTVRPVITLAAIFASRAMPT